MIAPVPVYPSPSMSSHPTHDPSSGKILSQRKHPSSNTSSFLDRQNAQRKRQRRQTAGALVTGLLGGNKQPEAPGSGKKITKKKSTAQPRPEIAIPPRGIGPIHEPNENDVLCGRGGRINAHQGNVKFREVVIQRKKDYLAPTTKKLEKAHIAANIVSDIRTKDPPGRFLKEDPDGSWYDIGDQKAIKKVGQALREDAPDIRQEIGSDEEEDAAGDSPGKNVASPKKAPHSPTEKTKKQPTATNATPTITNGPETLATVPIATAVSGRGAKVIPSSQRSVSSQHSKEPYAPLGYQTVAAPAGSYQPILPPANEQTTGKPIFPGMLGGRNAGVSGPAAAAMRYEESGYPPVPTQDVAFGRHFHMPEGGGDSSMISGMSGGTGGAGGTQLSGMSGISGISALTDPMSALSAEGGHRSGFQQPSMRPQSVQQMQAMRYNQLQQLRQNWANSSSNRTMNTLNSSDMRSIANGHQLQRSISWHEGHPGADNMSWADHSLAGGGIHDAASMVSGQQSFHSYYLRDEPMDRNGNIQMNSGTTGASSMLGGASLGLHLPPVPPQPPMPSPAQMYQGNSSSSNGDSSSRTGRMGTGGPSGGGSVASMSMASESLSGSIMSDLSENLVALDLAEPRLLDQFDQNH